GGDGNDVIYAGAGNDVVYGGKDNDLIHGDAGNDRLFGEDGNDWLYGDAGEDELTGGKGADYIIGGADADRIIWSASEPADAFIAGGNVGTASDNANDTLVITATALADTITLSAVGGLTSVTANDPDPSDGVSTTLQRISTGVKIEVNVATLIATDIDAVRIDAGAGADEIT